MTKQRLEAFTDGVIAIAITIMVLDLKTPAGVNLAALVAWAPALLAYALSFVNVGIFWNNHHHMFQATRRIDGKVLWANLFLLFAISLVPFSIRWVDVSHFAALPTASYGAVLTLSAVAYVVLERVIVAIKENAELAEAVGGRWKEWASLVFYVAAMGLAFVSPWIAIAIYVAVAMAWFIPDRRIERRLRS